ncbi:DtxR family transcriptional regulator [Eubacteriales bacterium]|uniref:metal-dependent transcriptional regulator n=1 Tax=Anaerotruncus TaxID=244127 RepID=UPI000E487F52|nr:metal-dependent transcriptional regulator [Anaerotruncus sp. AF02-27]MCM0707239.1 metal-dependent transcriptional regulator [Faecalicatena sp. BF-R-105]GKH48100.1 DtxR family transcriptional regulator [Oscillospiraceae bacterium]GKH49937.1 DtxR family transcriptional regulator [Eubacteriales bacterium]RGX55071.1 metal-dependent transcriptional regulator [Anaerotruncus sp. AF02-27]GKH62573.1 DtxR family transcriptional regulator [Eubacteriales bacterium]
MKIHQSAEDYLETILKLKEQLGIVRSIDIANELGYSKPSVSVAMKRLRENGYLEMDKEGYITLKPSGLEIAQRIYERHRVLRCLLLDLGVDEQTAAADACKIEHALSEQSFEKIKELTLERYEALQQQNKE